MSILWRYTLQGYLRIFSLSVCTFITVLIVSRFKEIARFTALCGDFGKTGLFILYQIPAILPIAIPISALIASLLLFQSLSKSSELVALRSAGINLSKILAPLLITSSLLALFNFSLTSSITPHCRRESKMLLYRETSQNPLLLLQRQNLVKLKHAHLDMEVDDDETIRNLNLVLHNNRTNRLTLISAQNAKIVENQLIAHNLATLTHLPTDTGFDTFMLENLKGLSMEAPILSNMMKKKRPRFDIAAFGFKTLFFHKNKNPALFERFRRVSLSLSVFTFTLLGCAFGIENARNPSKKNLMVALFLSVLVLGSYLSGKGFKAYPYLSMFALILPHPFIWITSIFRLVKINRGMV